MINIVSQKMRNNDVPSPGRLLQGDWREAPFPCPIKHTHLGTLFTQATAARKTHK